MASADKAKEKALDERIGQMFAHASWDDRSFEVMRDMTEGFSVPEEYLEDYAAMRKSTGVKVTRRMTDGKYGDAPYV